MDLREELAEKFGEYDNNNSYHSLKVNVTDFILSPECLKMLLPMYEVDEEKGALEIYKNKPNKKDGDWDISLNQSQALSKSDVIKVKEE